MTKIKSPQKSPPKSQLIICDIIAQAHLGVSLNERKKKQKIIWQVHCVLKESPHSKGYVCYEALVKKIKQHSLEKKFFLMESLARCVFKNLKKDFPKIKSLKLSLQKENSRVRGVKGPISYEYGDF